MSFVAMTTVLHHSRAKGTTKVVLLGIANHAGPGGAWPSVTRLAEYANVDARNVRVALKALVELGELEVRSQAGGDVQTRAGQRPNLYQVLVSCPWDCEGPPHHKRVSTPLSTPTPDGIVTPDETDRGGVTNPSGGPLTPASAEPVREPIPEVAAALSQSVTTDRARERCAEYGHTDDAGRCRQCASERLASGRPLIVHPPAPGAAEAAS